MVDILTYVLFTTTQKPIQGGPELAIRGGCSTGRSWRSQIGTSFRLCAQDPPWTETSLRRIFEHALMENVFIREVFSMRGQLEWVEILVELTLLFGVISRAYI